MVLLTFKAQESQAKMEARLAVFTLKKGKEIFPYKMEGGVICRYRTK
jgi:hypothetical protein